MERTAVLADMSRVFGGKNPTAERLGVYYKELVQLGIRYR